jgi:hypothetical protein
MKAMKILEDCLIPGPRGKGFADEHAEKGAVIEVDEDTANKLSLSGRAIAVEELEKQAEAAKERAEAEAKEAKAKVETAEAQAKVAVATAEARVKEAEDAAKKAATDVKSVGKPDAKHHEDKNDKKASPSHH